MAVGLRWTLAALLLVGIAAIDLARGQPLDSEIDPEEPVALVADAIDYDTTTRTLTASGDVEVYYAGRTLTADRIVYNDATERISAEGDLVLRDGSGATLYADFADLDAELKDGLLRGARTVLDRFSRLSAVEARRVEDRYNILSRAVYSPCEVCEDNPTPLWRIRADRVIHDQEEKVIHYEGARLEVFGVPVLWTPYFSHPDPTVDRATGFLRPEFKSDSENFGFGFKLPYYIVIDDQSDLTLTPFVTTNDGVVGELEFRRAFRNGGLLFAGSIARSDFTGETEQHGHVDTEGRFRLENRIEWGWDVEFASDDGYLRYFDISDEDRLTSEIFLSRYGRSGFFDVSAARFQSLRDNEPAGQIPVVIPDLSARYEIDESLAGGRLGLFASSQGLVRNNGEDTGRLSLGADWERTWLTPVGLSLTGFAEMRGDVFFVGDAEDLAQDPTVFRFHPMAGVEARYPLISDGEIGFQGITQVIEPIAQAIVAPFGGNDDDIPNEDSLITEFDETSLFERDHFSGFDRVEEGPRFNLGVRYALSSDFGVGFDATVGRVLRFDAADEFSSGSGLAGTTSDWVGTWSASYDPYVTVSQRLRVADDGFEVTRNEALVALNLGPARLDLGYVFFEADPGEDAFVDREELTARALLEVTDEWSVNGFLRRDLEEREFVNLGGGVRFANECCSVQAFVRRSFTDQDNVSGGTSFGLAVELFTLGGTGGNVGG